MPTYAIGDVQGCYRELRALLDRIAFDPARDRLWFTGDLVNRGPDSLATLRFVAGLGAAAITVLGNHDLHLLACRHLGPHRMKRGDTLGPVLAAPDGDELLEWLRHRPLLHHDEALGWTLVHAGFDPSWTLHDARSCAHEVESALRAEDCIGFLAAMYGNAPRRWDPALRGDDRLRVITNCFTRMRYCKADGALDFSAKGPLGSQPSSLRPWFMLPQRASRELRIVFGHWSTLRLSLDEQQRYRVYPLDTGAVWGGPLSALRLEDSAPFAVPSSMPAQFGQD